MQLTEKYRGKILAIRASEFPGSDGQMIKGFNLDIKTTPNSGISAWVNDDGVINLAQYRVGQLINVTVEERLRQDGRLKYKVIEISNAEIEEDFETASVGLEKPTDDVGF